MSALKNFLTSKQPHRHALANDQTSYLPIALVLFAALFNAALAIINARIAPMSGNIVILAEVLVVAASHIYILRNFDERMVNWYFLILAFAIFALLRIANTGTADAKYFRDVFLIVTFILLGMTSTIPHAIQMMVALHAAVILGTLLEASCVECYTEFFAVKDFYITTRGISEEEFTNLASDLYVSATRPEARFLPFFDLHRLSSIFLEPVSLGNFMIGSVAFTAATWRHLNTNLRLFFSFSIALMLFACDGRLATIASLAIVVISLGNKLLPKHIGLVFLPMVTIGALFIANVGELKPGVDDLAGRIAYTANLINDMQLLDYAGLSDRLLERSVDSGSVYLVITQSFLGLVALWTFLTLNANESTTEQKIYKNGILLYLALTTIVSYSFLSIKTGAPLWFIFGCMLNAVPSAVDGVRRHASRSHRSLA